MSYVLSLVTLQVLLTPYVLRSPYISFILGTQTEKTATAKHQKASCSWPEVLHFKPSDAEVLAVSPLRPRACSLQLSTTG